MCKLLFELTFKVYESNSPDIFMDSFEMLELLRDAIKTANESKDNIDHIYLMIPHLLNSIRASTIINLSTPEDIQSVFTEQKTVNDEVEKVRFYRLFVASHIKK